MNMSGPFLGCRLQRLFKPFQVCHARCGGRQSGHCGCCMGSSGDRMLHGFLWKKKVSWTLVVEKLMFRSFGPCLFRLLHYRLLHIITI